MKNFIGFIGVDIGATKIIFLGVRHVPDTCLTLKIKTPKTRKGLLKVLKENIKSLKDSRKIEGIGIGVAGVLDKKREKILFSPNIGYLKNFPLAKILEKEIGIKVVMENDVNCFTLAEAIFGAGKDKNVVFGITLGSGVGGGIIIKSKIKNQKSKINIYKGAFGGAGEVGHLTIKFDGPRCECGNFGCFEQYGSEKFFKRKKVFSKTLEEKANRGDKKAKLLFKEYGRYLGIGLANVVNLLDPEIIVIGGGISKALRHFLPEAKKEAKKRILSPISKKNLMIKVGNLGEKAGAIGAVLSLILK